MSIHFVANQELSTETCCACGMLFAMPLHTQNRLRENRKTFYCPDGHRQFYSGKSETEKLKDELERERQKREASEARAFAASNDLAQVARAHRKMRERVMNGVCPCCNRSFGNLREHMKTQHADFGLERTILALREAFGLTQSDVAKEAGVNATQISKFERGQHVSGNTKTRLQIWLETQ